MTKNRTISEDHSHLYKSSLPTATCVVCGVYLYLVNSRDQRYIVRANYRHLRRQNAFLIKRCPIPNTPPETPLNTINPYQVDLELTLSKNIPPNRKPQPPPLSNPISRVPMSTDP